MKSTYNETQCLLEARFVTIFVSALFVPVFTVCGEEIGLIVFGSYECGKYLTASAYLVLFMSISNITTSMLNSMGKENRTLIYYIISGILMLLSIWFLPKYVGIYSLLIGFSFIYGLTSVLNLILLNKLCKEKPIYLKFLFGSTLLTLPTIILGIMLEKLLLPHIGTFFTFTVCGIIMVIFNCLLYFGCGMIEPKNFFDKVNLLYG